jgi:60 kDa SS-A/Ro ribonucleoprotein
MPFGQNNSHGVKAYSVGTNSVTPQTMRARSDQVVNHAGGYVFQVTPWTQLERFLVMGITDNTYYVDKQRLFVGNREVIYKCVQLDPFRTIDTIVKISDEGRCVRNISCVFALSIAASSPDVAVRRYALDNLGKVCRIGTDLFAFDGFMTRKRPGKGAPRPQRGWSHMLRSAVAKWYNDHTPEDLAFEVAKYQSRDGGDHLHMIRMSHLYGKTPEHNSVIRWVLDNPEKYPYNVEDLPEILRTKIALEHVTTLREVLTILRETRAPEEFIPGEWKQHDEVWREMLKNLGTNAIFRNLCNLGHRGSLTKETVRWLTEERLTQRAIERSRMHPIKVLLGYAMYLDGRRTQRSGGFQQWKVDPTLKRHLEQCFEWGFKNVQSTGKRVYLGMDVSGSMGSGSIYEGITWLTPRVMSAALANLFYKTEEHVRARGFSHTLVDLPITKNMSLDQTVRAISGIPFGGTDCSLPILDALRQKEVYDLFLVMTDNETWAGNIQPFEALNRYRAAVNPRAKLCVLAMTPTRFSIADPNCDYMLDICGIDSNIYDLIRNFMIEGDEA